MALDSGTRLGQYEIIASIGVGGMGEVYRARDTKLGREVAIKVLREELSKDPDRLSRFEREAKLLASLNHPAIATLYGFEDDFLVMELVEGETLAERIARGPIPIDEALPLFIQIAKGVEAAHEKTVVHRDLKPANIKITPDGRPKILDFGLAKAFGGDEDSPLDASQSPTLTKGTRLRQGFGEAGTQLGAIMGTAAYMSPEQARGKVVDKRTDVWAFGCCLYEALTGNSPFARDNVTDTLAAVVKEDSDFDLLPMGTPAKVRALLRRCLRRDVRARQRDIGDVGLELSEQDDEASSDSRAAWTRKQLLTVVASALGALVLGFSIHRAVVPATRDTRTVARPVSRSIIDLPPEAPLGRPLSGFESPKVAISPDGAQLVYVGEFDGGTALFQREIASFEVSRIAGTEGAIHPFFSPDGRWVGFLTNTQVKIVSLRGDPPLTLSAVRTPLRASWKTNDSIYVTDNAGWGLTRVSASDGSASQVAMLFPQFPGAYWVNITDVLRDGEAALVAVSSRSLSADYADIYLTRLDTLETTRLIQVRLQRPLPCEWASRVCTRWFAARSPV